MNICNTGTTATNCFARSFDCGVLTDDVVFQPFTETVYPLELMLRDVGRRDPGPYLDDVGEILRRQTGGVELRLERFQLVLSVDRRDLYVGEALVFRLLLFLIGPAEEFFWRGYVQRTLGKLLPGEHASDHAFLLTAAVYALVHVWSFNFMLVMAALTAGLVWGLVYRLRPAWLPALVVSHAVWDALVFIIIPI